MLAEWVVDFDAVVDVEALPLWPVRVRKFAGSFERQYGKGDISWRSQDCHTVAKGPSDSRSPSVPESVSDMKLPSEVVSSTGIAA